ncbi:methyltransferase [Paracraurococcus lichenis]|uniref:Methyltransferase n=1 Tax=Paracraurococcus lichenis TaxID=3064888 RepID=A0ABT9E9F3_9PROT|nr:methyltransferase [Paracraurococcus sp. LOR1-02]MDO9712825.1 methyltransferase [Paracraurococcus sp. LOR1-02]
MTGGTPRSAIAEVLQLATAYQGSRALHVAVRLGIPDLLANGPRSVEELAAAADAHAPSLRRLLRALVAFEVLVEEADGRFGLGALGTCLCASAPDSVSDLVTMWGDEDFWRTWSELEHSVRTGETAATHLFGTSNAFARYAADERLGKVFNAGMTALSASVAAALVSSYDFSGVARVVDVAGGQGRLLVEILRSNPRARGVLMDLPTVVTGAADLLRAAGIAERCEVVEGDMFATVPVGGDVYLLKSILHDWDDESALAILRNCRRAMSDGARLLLVERVLPERVASGSNVRTLLLSDLNMLVRNGGRERTAAEFSALLGAAGLRLTQVIPTGTPFSVVEALPVPRDAETVRQQGPMLAAGCGPHE